MKYLHIIWGKYNQISKKKSATPKTHYGFDKLGSKMHAYLHRKNTYNSLLWLHSIGWRNGRGSTYFAKIHNFLDIVLWKSGHTDMEIRYQIKPLPDLMGIWAHINFWVGKTVSCLLFKRSQSTSLSSLFFFFFFFFFSFFSFISLPFQLSRVKYVVRASTYQYVPLDPSRPLLDPS